MAPDTWQNNAASIGVTVAGNQVFMIYRPDVAARMIKTGVEAGYGGHPARLKALI